MGSGGERLSPTRVHPRLAHFMMPIPSVWPVFLKAKWSPALPCGRYGLCSASASVHLSVAPKGRSRAGSLRLRLRSSGRSCLWWLRVSFRITGGGEFCHRCCSVWFCLWLWCQFGSRNPWGVIPRIPLWWVSLLVLADAHPPCRGFARTLAELGGFCCGWGASFGRHICGVLSHKSVSGWFLFWWVGVGRCG